MGISKQIGWSPEANLYYQISQQLERLIGVTSKVVLVPPIPTVTIGSQTWMSQNLNVDRYLNGDFIPEVQDTTTWETTTEGAWCYYDNDPVNGAIYGKLYNWYAVTDPRGLAPEGYRVPSIADYSTLFSTLGNQSDAGGPMKEVGTVHWQAPNTGATNSSGFTALPGGIRDKFAAFSLIGFINQLWTTDENDFTSGVSYQLSNDSIGILNQSNDKFWGSSVRCIKN
jgi:uncharacterized protein (TIGR02145 family)